MDSPLTPSAAWLPPIAITGPTASGKTAAALRLAQVLPIEIISVDSTLVYRRMNIGSAKPSSAERDAVVHHLIDIRDPFESYNAAEFLKDATVLVSEISQRGKWPVFVGGTMLYLQCLTKGIDEMPAVDLGVRAEVTARAAQVGWAVMHQQLQALDPVTAARLPPSDAQRIGRALEVVLGTGQTLSSLQTGRNRAIPGVLEEARIISLEPTERSVLHLRIAARLTAMLDAGFLAEALQLHLDPTLSPDMPAMRSVGYRQAFEVLTELTRQGHSPNPLLAKDRTAFFAHWHEPAAAATRQLAKRQLTWLRAMKLRHIVAMESQDAAQQVCDLALALTNPHSKL